MKSLSLVAELVKRTTAKYTGASAAEEEASKGKTMLLSLNWPCVLHMSIHLRIMIVIVPIYGAVFTALRLAFSSPWPARPLQFPGEG